MGFRLTRQAMDCVLQELSQRYLIYAPKRFEQGGHFSDTDKIRYGEIHSSEEIVWDEKSSHSFKEVLLPITQTLFYFTEDHVTEASIPQKEALVFLRSCDLHAVRRLDDIYLHNGPEDYYYQKIKERVHFVLMGCTQSFENCFCADMGTNRSTDYALSIHPDHDSYLLDCKQETWRALLEQHAAKQLPVSPAYVTQNQTRINIPENLTAEVSAASMWEEYDGRCINCGRCNYSCPTCTCYTMQDLFYTDNGRAGERRRVWASCMVDGFTDVAGGGCYRKTNGQRMRFKALHKVLDYNQRFGYHMCVGCGRCDDVCPEYISFSRIINRLDDAMKEVAGNGAE